MRVGAPRTTSERQLERLQIDVTRGEHARIARDRLIIAMHQNGMPQAEIARRLSRASARASGEPITRNAVQKIVAKLTYNGENHDRDPDQALR